MRIPFLDRRLLDRPSAAPHGAPTDDAPATAMPADPESPPAAEPVMVYGGSWCADCHVVTRYLDKQRVPYRWIDLDKDPAAQERIAAMGYRAIPVVMLPDGRTLVEPSIRQLAEALGIGPA